MTIEITRATRADRELLIFVDDLAKKNSHAVGFLPMVAYEAALDRERVLLLTENGQPAGYLIHGPEITNSKIYQVVIAEDVRRFEHGRALVDHLREHLTQFDVHRLTLHCADDLAANDFWKAIGFYQIGQRLKDRTGRRWQNRYEQAMPAATIHKLKQSEAVRSRGLESLSKLLLQGKVSIADILEKNPRPRTRRRTS